MSVFLVRFYFPVNEIGRRSLCRTCQIFTAAQRFGRRRFGFSAPSIIMQRSTDFAHCDHAGRHFGTSLTHQRHRSANYRGVATKTTARGCAKRPLGQVNMRLWRTGTSRLAVLFYYPSSIMDHVLCLARWSTGGASFCRGDILALSVSGPPAPSRVIARRTVSGH